MYSLSHFKENDPRIVIDFMKQYSYSFTILIHNASHQSHAIPIPLLFEERNNRTILLKYMIKKQNYQMVVEKNHQAFVAFIATHTYVSATGYHSSYQSSTWKNMSVHARSVVKFLDEKWFTHVYKTSQSKDKKTIPALSINCLLKTKMVNKCPKAINARKEKIFDK